MTSMSERDTIPGDCSSISETRCDNSYISTPDFWVFATSIVGRQPKGICERLRRVPCCRPTSTQHRLWELVRKWRRHRRKRDQPDCSEGYFAALLCRVASATGVANYRLLRRIRKTNSEMAGLFRVARASLA